MRKRWSILLALALMLGLSACGRDYRRIQGVVTEVQLSESGELTSFVVCDREGKETGILLTGDTHAVPAEPGGWTTSGMRAEFQKDLQPDVQVSASCLPKKRKLALGDGREVAAYQADYITITGQLKRGALTLEDGTVIDLLDEGYYAATHTYCLPDGVELLWVRGPSGPEGHYVGGLESFDDLSQRAREKILAYYEERGLLYDEGEELEKAYAAYLEQGEDFQTRMVEQDVSPSASSEKVIYFHTGLTLPLYLEGDGTVYTLSLGDAFDRETGEYLSLWDLFQCSEEEARQATTDAPLDWRGSGGVRAGLEAAFDPERVVVGTDGLYMHFEPGVISEEPTGYAFNADLSKLQDLMYGWAVPVKQD